MVTEPVEPVVYSHEELAPPDYKDPVIEVYKKDVDRTLLVEMLKLTPQLWNSPMKFAVPVNRCVPRSSTHEDRFRQGAGLRNDCPDAGSPRRTPQTKMNPAAYPSKTATAEA